MAYFLQFLFLRGERLYAFLLHTPSSFFKNPRANICGWGKPTREAGKMAFEDQRAHPRANLRWSVSVQLSGAVAEGVTKDISEGGAYVCCANPLGPEEVLDMVINAPDKPLNVKAEVVWSSMSGLDLDDEITPRGMGVRFLNIGSEERSIIAKAVAEYLSADVESEELQASMFDTLEIN
jgi:hypothetical protein